MFDELKAPGKAALELPVPDPAGKDNLSLTVLVAKGQAPGPVLAVLAAVHGDEFEGVLAIQDAFRRLSAGKLRGTFVAVPVTNLPAYLARVRNTPEDGKNLARVFPGRPEGSITERIAYHVGSAIISKADFLLDLHSSGAAMTSPTLVGYYAHPGPAGDLAAAAARAFGAPVIWEHPSIAPGRTLSLAAELSIPALYTEATGGMHVRPSDLRVYTQGILNVMGYLGMLERRSTKFETTEGSRTPPPRYFLEGDGNTDAMPVFSTSGLFRPSVRVLQLVRKGELIGRVRDLEGKILEEIYAYQDGRVVFLRAVPPVTPGETAVLITASQQPSIVKVRANTRDFLVVEARLRPADDVRLEDS